MPNIRTKGKSNASEADTEESQQTQQVLMILITDLINECLIFKQIAKIGQAETSSGVKF